MEEQTIRTVDVDSIDELLLKEEAVLSEVVEVVKAAPVAEEGEEQAEDEVLIRWNVVKVGENVTNYKAGDIIYDVVSVHSLGYFDALGKRFVLTDKYNIKLGVRKNG